MRECVDYIQTTTERVELGPPEAHEIRLPRHRKSGAVFIRSLGIRRVEDGVDYIIHRVGNK